MALLIALGLPAAASAARQSVSSTFSTRQPASPVKTIVSELPPGSVIDTTAIEQCKASDAELMAQGAAACPPGSLVSAGTVLTDSGSAGLVPRFTTNRVQNFNNTGELIGIAESQDPPTRVVSRAKVSGRTVTFTAPTLSGNPPPDPYTAFRDLRLTGPALVRGGAAYTRTPPVCPRSGDWTATFTFSYQDGASERTQTGTPCRRDLKPPRVRLRGVPLGRCASGNFTVRVRIGERSPVRRVALYVDGRLVHATTHRVFRRRIRARRLRAGRHRLTVIARDSSGNRGRRTLRFRRCG
jgi:hypothetical protein